MAFEDLPEPREEGLLELLEQRHPVHRPRFPFINERVKPLKDILAEDIPRGFSAEDVATDCG